MGLSLITVSSDYPSDANPERGAFVHVLMRDFHRLGAEPVVLAPETIFSLRGPPKVLKPSPTVELRDGVAIHRPRFLSLSNKVLPGGMSTYPWTVASFGRTVLRSGPRMAVLPHLCYGHFLYPAGLGTQRLAQKLGVPSVVALGESSFDHYETHFGLARIQADLARFWRIIAVSDAIKTLCVQRYRVPSERVKVFPNAVDQDIFHPRDRVVSRRKLGLPEDRPIVAFVGHFNERKGPLRLLEAIKARPDVAAFFLGSGPMTPKGSQVLFTGTVSQDKVPDWLSAADLFALPTLAEGSCNAILEAMACGLPVVSSDRPFNQGIIDSSVGILVEPADCRQLAEAIASLIDDGPKRETMATAALARIKGFQSRDRARRILEWLTPSC